MTRWIALLRGINVSGKNQIPMQALKEGFSALGYHAVRTCLNSGNVVFSAAESQETALAEQIQEMIRVRFALQIPVFVLRQDALNRLLAQAPAWWGTNDRAVYDNLIFVMPAVSALQIADEIGEPTEGLERIFILDQVIFWSFDRRQYAKANWWKKTARAGIGEKLTIRTANTLRKLAGL